MKIEPSKTYLTAASYVVVTAKGDDNCLLSTVETSPGVMCSGKSIQQVNACYAGSDSHLGWYYDEEGRCVSPTIEWKEKLRITEELPFSLPTLPTGYKWKGDFPQYRVPVLGEHVIAWSGANFINNVLVCDKDFLSCTTLDLRRLIVEPVSVATPQKYRDIDPLIDTPEDHDEFFSETIGKWIVRNSINGRKNDSFYPTGTKYRRPVSSSVSPVPSGMVEVTHLPDYVLKRNGDGYLTGGAFILAKDLFGVSEFTVKWYTDIKPDTYKLYATQENYNEWLASQEKKVDESMAKPTGTPTVKINGVEIKGVKLPHQMETIKVKLSEGETSTVREEIKKAGWVRPEQLTVGYNNKPTLRQRAFKYWLGDPIKTITKEVKTALPYIVLGGSAWGITYSVFHIEEIKDLYNKHVPSVSISIEAPEILSN